MTTYRRIRHAAHYLYQPGKGHDLEEWDVRAAGREPARSPDVPTDAEYHHGYVDRDGVQHWVYVRRAAFGEGTCPHCEDYPTNGTPADQGAHAARDR